MSLRFASAISPRASSGAAVESLIAAVDRQITLGMVDLVLFFSSQQHARSMERVTNRLSETFPNAVMVGCTACGTIGVDREIEKKPSMALWTASLPEVNIWPFHLRQNQLENAQNHLDLERLVGVSTESEPVFIALADPFRLDLFDFLEQVNEYYPGAPLIGGVASGSYQPGRNMVIINGEVHNEGVVGVALTGNLKIDAAVSQGCRPIGKPFVVTRGQHNIILELGGHPPLSRLEDVLSCLSPEDERLARQSLLMGRAIDEYKEEFTRGDFLIQNITGADRSSGAIAVAGPVRVGSTVQFHVRDSESADEDLREALQPYVGGDVQAALLFGCNGRGTHMWSDPGHDVGVVRERLGKIPVAGMFCAGEFGPIGGTNFVHGFTASIALFRPGGLPDA
jgi:small ligand-binding sensory domain FIST